MDALRQHFRASEVFGRERTFVDPDAGGFLDVQQQLRQRKRVETRCHQIFLRRKIQIARQEFLREEFEELSGELFEGELRHLA